MRYFDRETLLAYALLLIVGLIVIAALVAGTIIFEWDWAEFLSSGCC